MEINTMKLEHVRHSTPINQDMLSDIKELHQALYSMYSQHKCGCGNPACNRCVDDSDNGEVTTHSDLVSTSNLDVGDSCDYTTKILYLAQSIGCEIKIPAKCDYRDHIEMQSI